MENDRFLTARAVTELTTLSRATIERKVKSGDLPAPIYLSERRKAWKESTIRAWMAEREPRAA
jgi:prophage regulatory protein